MPGHPAQPHCIDGHTGTCSAGPLTSDGAPAAGHAASIDLLPALMTRIWHDDASASGPPRVASSFENSPINIRFCTLRL